MGLRWNGLKQGFYKAVVTVLYLPFFWCYWIDAWVRRKGKKCLFRLGYCGQTAVSNMEFRTWFFTDHWWLGECYRNSTFSCLQCCRTIWNFLRNNVNRFCWCVATDLFRYTKWNLKADCNLNNNNKKKSRKLIVDWKKKKSSYFSFSYVQCADVNECWGIIISGPERKGCGKKRKLAEKKKLQFFFFLNIFYKQITRIGITFCRCLLKLEKLDWTKKKKKKA